MPTIWAFVYFQAFANSVDMNRSENHSASVLESGLALLCANTLKWTFVLSTVDMISSAAKQIDKIFLFAFVCRNEIPLPILAIFIRSHNKPITIVVQFKNDPHVFWINKNVRSLVLLKLSRMFTYAGWLTWSINRSAEHSTECFA